MPIDARTFRQALGSFPTGVAVVTTVTGAGAPVGVTIGSFTSLSLDPPLVLFCLDESNEDLIHFTESGMFAVNVLASGQSEISARFGSRNGAKWAGLSFERGGFGLPLVPGCLATLECRVTSVVAGGDHRIVIGQVERLADLCDGEALVHWRGAYCTAVPLGD